MPAKQVLIVEDERPIREMIAFGLKRAGFEVREAEDCRAARAAVADARPDLVLVDWMLPDMSGLELTRALKRDRETRELPVIILTARAAEGDKVAGLEGGADDYVTKPFSPRELLARINAVLRRSGANGADELIEFERLVLDQGSHRVMVGARTVALGPTEYRMLEFFMRHPERVYTRDQLLDRVRRRLAVRQSFRRARRRTRAAPRLGTRQPRAPRMVAAPPQLRRPARHRRGVGRDHRPDRAPAPPQGLPQTALRAAHAPVAALHRGAAERRSHPQRAARDRVVQPHGGAAAQSAPHGRSGHAHREPAARAAVRALPGPTGLHKPGGHAP